MKKIFFILFVSSILLAACGSHSDHTPTRPSPQMIDVRIFTDPGPDQLNPGESIQILAEVTLGEDFVDNAEEVMFEIWEEGHEERSKKVEGSHQGDGIYSITHIFDQKGIYYAVSHVTVGEMHNMPRLKLVLGNVPGEDFFHEQEQHEGEMNHHHH